MKSLYDFLIQNKDFKKDVLSVQSPQDRVDGPYKIVKTNDDKQYAIVTLKWDGNKSLGIRWFDTPQGMPLSHDHKVWFIIPEDLWEAVISTMEPDIQKYVKEFLEIN